MFSRSFLKLGNQNCVHCTRGRYYVVLCKEHNHLNTLALCSSQSKLGCPSGTSTHIPPLLHLSWGWREAIILQSHLCRSCWVLSDTRLTKKKNTKQRKKLHPIHKERSITREITTYFRKSFESCLCGQIISRPSTQNHFLVTCGEKVLQ